MSRAELGARQARMWRITVAEPRGCMMWFDPDREIPMIGSLPSDSEDSEAYYEGGALDEVRVPGADGTTVEEGGVPRKGGETKTSATDGCDLPF